MKKVISVLLCLVMMFSLATPAYASSISDKVDDLKSEISTNVKVTKKSIKKIIELSGKTAKKLEPVILEFVLDSDNWEKAAEVMMNAVIAVYEKIKDSIPEKPQPPVEPEQPDVPPVDPDEPDVPPVDPDEPDVPPVDPDEPDVPPVDPDEPDVPPVDPDEPEEPAVPSIIDVIKGLTIQDFVRIIQTYFIINMEDIDETSKDIIDYAEYKYVTTADGKKTVYIMVDIQKHPELLNRDLLMETVKGLYEKQNEEFNEGADILMSYEHIAGELALHAILYAVTNEYVTISGATEGTLYEYWVRTQQADLNFDESRIPTEIIEIVGTYIMGVFIVNLYTIFKILK